MPGRGVAVGVVATVAVGVVATVAVGALAPVAAVAVAVGALVAGVPDPGVGVALSPLPDEFTGFDPPNR